MSDIQSVNELLVLVSSILDTISNEIRATGSGPEKENIDKIDQASSLIGEIQAGIYKKYPELAPEHLKRHSPLPPEVNKKFGDVLVKANALCDIGEPEKAIKLFKKYISEDPPPFIVGLLEGRIETIKNGSHKDFSLSMETAEH